MRRFQDHVAIGLAFLGFLLCTAGASIAIAVLVTNCSGCTAPRGVAVAKQYDTVAVVVATCPTLGGQQLGTAVVVSRNQVLTAFHVIDCPDATIKVQSFLGAVLVVVHPDATDRGDDLVRLLADGKPFAYDGVRIGAKPEPGDTVCAVSAVPRVGRRCGQVQWDGDAKPPGDILHDAITEPGNSGGPLYNAAGDLVGIVSHLWYCSNGQICGGRATSLADRAWIMPA